MAWFAARTVSVNTNAPCASRMALARWPSSSYFPLDRATISRRLENASRYSRAARPSAPASRSARCATAARKSPNGSSGIPCTWRRWWRAFTSCCSVAVYSARSSMLSSTPTSATRGRAHTPSSMACSNP